MEKMYICLAFPAIICAIVFYFACRAKKALEIISRNHSNKENKLVFSYLRDLNGFRALALLFVLIFGVVLGCNIADKGFFSFDVIVMLIDVVLSALVGVYSDFYYRKFDDLC